MIVEQNSVLTLGQMSAVYDYMDDIIDSLDDDALVELFGGSITDVDKMMMALFEETSRVLTFNEGKIKSGAFGYLDKFTESVEESLRCFSFNYFIQNVIPDFEMNWHHLEWGQLVQMYNKLSIIAARDHGKSYFFSFAYPLWKLYRYQRPSPIKQVKAEYNAKIGMIITNEFGLAKHLLGMVKDEIEANDILKEKLYPGKTGGWAETEINTLNGGQLIVKSFGSKMRGFHPHWIVTDDFMNDSVIYSEDQRNKYISMFHSVIMNMIVPSGQVINVGTPYTTTDLFANLKTSKKWRVFEYPAIFPDGSMLWSNRHSIESILDKKITQGSIIFSREILCRPISSESTIFPWSILEKSFIGMDAYTIVPNIWSHPRKFKKVVMGCDFAMSSNIGADYSVFMVLGVDDLDNYWVLNYWRGKGASYNEQIAQMKKLHQDYNPEVIMVETNQAQILFAQMARDAGLPIVEHTTTTNKYHLQDGLPGVAILFEQGRMKLPRGDQKSRDLTDMMCMEFSSVTFSDKGKLESVGGHDDICMATWIAVLAANYVNKSFNFSFI